MRFRICGKASCGPLRRRVSGMSPCGCSGWPAWLRRIAVVHGSSRGGGADARRGGGGLARAHPRRTRGARTHEGAGLAEAVALAVRAGGRELPFPVVPGAGNFDGYSGGPRGVGRPGSVMAHLMDVMDAVAGDPLCVWMALCRRSRQRSARTRPCCRTTTGTSCAGPNPPSMSPSASPCPRVTARRACCRRSCT